MRMHALRLAAALAVAGLILAQALPLATLGVPAATLAEAAPAGNATAASAARAYVMAVAGFINKTLRMAERFNITIPGNLTVYVNESLRLIAWAKANLTVNETLAVKLATNASLTFAPVASYVWSNLPSDVKKEMEARALEKMVSERLRLAEKLREKIERLQNETGVNMTRVMERLNQTIQLLVKAREEARKGNITGARILVHEAARQLQAEAVVAYHRIHKAVMGEARLAIITLQLARQVEGLSDAVNKTMEMLNGTSQPGESLVRTLRALEERNAGLLAKAERLLQYAEPNTTIYQALTVIVEGLNETSVYLNMSVQAALEGNTSWVAANLTMALESLNATLAQLAQINLPAAAREAVREAHKYMEKARHAREAVEARVYAGISKMLDRKMSELQKLYEKYEQGKISKARFKAKLLIEKAQLEALKSRLPADAPQWLIEKINSILQWIDEHMPS